MNRNARIFGFLIFTLAALGGCSSEPAKQAKKAAAPDTIQGKAQVLKDPDASASDAALNAGGSSALYLWVGAKRYRLYLRTPADITHGQQYVVEGVYAQKAIDTIGDPDQGKNGYPLQSSCEHVVRTAWSNLAFDDFDATVSLVSNVIKRHPGTPLFLVMSVRPVTSTEGSAVADANAHEVPVPAEKQRASLIAGPAVEPAPLWKPEGGTVHCPVVIDTEGKISELESGAQLCESVPWSEFSYKPLVQGGHPVKVSTEVEVRFEAHK
jgi:hypothetical protein